jgi:stage III sporulation protein SpoIIIAA
MHYKTANAAIIHTLLKYYQPRAIHSERTVEVVDDRETIAGYQNIANDIGFLSRLGEIDIILPCDKENAIYAAIISEWLYKGGGLILPVGIVVL